MEEKKRTLYIVSFPHEKLTAEQERKLKTALKCAAVTVLPERLKGQVRITPKVNDPARE